MTDDQPSGSSLVFFVFLCKKLRAQTFVLSKSNLRVREMCVGEIGSPRVGELGVGRVHYGLW